jgi:hypothetical protein
VAVNAEVAGDRRLATQASTAPTAAQLDQDIAPETQQVISDLNSGNYSDAWSTALSTSPLFGTNYNTGTTDPLLEAMESGSGLQQLDPSKTWNSSSINAYYDALGSNPVYNGKTVDGVNGQAESLGKNPYSLWGSGADLTNGHDASTNSSTAGDNSAPDVERFAGARPTQSFLSKYGADIATLVAAVAAPYAAPELAGALGLGTSTAALAGAGALYGAGTTAAIDAASGKPITLGGEAIGAATGATGSGALKGLGATVGASTGFGTAAGNALVGAGTGAATSALKGGNPLIGAISGGIGGAAQGLTTQAGQAINNATGLPVALGAGVAGGALGAATSAGLTSIAGGNAGNAALTGGVAGALTAGVGASTGNNAYGSLAGSLGKMAISPLLSSGGGSAVQGATSTNPYDFSSTSSTLGSLLGPALTSAAGIYGSQNAAEDQQKWDSTAIGTQTASLANNTGLYNSAIGSEQNALANANTAYGNAAAAQSTLLGNANSIYGAQISAGNNADAEIQQLEGGTSTPADYSNFMNSPGYQFAINQGTQAIQRAAAANGAAYTPNTLTNVGQYVTGTASQNYNNYMAQLQNTASLGAQGNAGLASANTSVAGNLANIYGQQAGTNATISGQEAGTYNSQATNATGINNNISQLQQNEGVAQATGVAGASNSAANLTGALGNGISSLLGLGGSNQYGTIGGANASGVSYNPDTNAGGTGMSVSQYNTANAPSDSEISAQTAGTNSLGNLFDPSTVNNPGFAPLNISNDVEDTASDINTSDWLNLGDDI